MSESGLARAEQGITLTECEMDSGLPLSYQCYLEFHLRNNGPAVLGLRCAYQPLQGSVAGSGGH